MFFWETLGLSYFYCRYHCQSNLGQESFYLSSDVCCYCEGTRQTSVNWRLRKGLWKKLNLFCYLGNLLAGVFLVLRLIPPRVLSSLVHHICLFQKSLFSVGKKKGEKHGWWVHCFQWVYCRDVQSRSSTALQVLDVSLLQHTWFR